MAGLYVHIPFCKKRCLYCDFYSTTLLGRRKEYVEALLKEIEARKNEASEPIRTIYIGGGTPSTLETGDIQRILRAIDTANTEEITVEVNPGDVTPEYLQALREAGVNRLSIGVQSFQDELLRLIGRRHNGEQAKEAVLRAQRAGFDNLSIDLMYALPTQTMEAWKADIKQALMLHIQHISCYGLMYEEGTALTTMRDNGEVTAIDEDEENAMYDILCERLKEAGLVHYEVSNFALPGFEARHNSRYWDHTPYIGIGAGAHSLVGRVRSWNPNDVEKYIQGGFVREQERLTDKDWYNETIMLGLRTNKGIDKKELSNPLFVSYLSANCLDKVTEFLQAGLLRETAENRVIATQKGLHVLNRIIEALMIE